MGINQFKTYALRTMCEAHLWKVGEEDIFTLKGCTYKIGLVNRGSGIYAFTLTQIYPGAPEGEQEGTPMYFQDMGRLFHHIFDSRWISYE